MTPDKPQPDYAGDPHFTEEWFELTRRAAIPPDTTVVRWDIGNPPTVSSLHLMRLSESSQVLQGLSTFYSPLYGPTDQRHVSRQRLRDYFRDTRLRKDAPSSIKLAPMDPESDFFSLAVETLRATGWIVDTYFCFGNWYTQLDRQEGFAAYFQGLPSKLRNTITRARKKLEKDPTFDIRILAKPGPELDVGIADFVTVYNSSWKRPEPFPDFIPGLCRLAAENGWLRLGLLHLDGKAVAGQIWLVKSGVAHIVKLAYDQAYAKRSVGSVLTARLAQHVIDEDDVVELDYLIGDDAYKRDWTPQRRERHGIIAFNPRRLSGLTGALVHFGGLFRKLFFRVNQSTKP